MTTKPPPPLLLPLNLDPVRAIEQAIVVLNTIIERHPEVRRDFDCESFIFHELAPALEATRVEPDAEVITRLRKLYDKTAEAHDGDYPEKVNHGLVAVYAFGKRQSARPEALQNDAEDAARYRWLRACALDDAGDGTLGITYDISCHAAPNHADIDRAIDDAMPAETIPSPLRQKP